MSLSATENNPADAGTSFAHENILGFASFYLSIAGMIITLLSFIWDFKFLPEGFVSLKLAILSVLLPIDMVILIAGLVLGIIGYAIDSKRDYAMIAIILSAFFGLVALNNIMISFQILDKIKI